MRLPFVRPRIRHPFFPNLPATPAVSAKGSVLAMAGSFEEVYRAGCRPARPRRAVFVLTPAHKLLSRYDRDYLWDLLQVPTYALLTDANGKIVGWECEAQDGFHISDDSQEVSCACGRPGARLFSRASQVKSPARPVNVPVLP